MSRRGHVVRSYSTGDIPWRERVGRMGAKEIGARRELFLVMGVIRGTRLLGSCNIRRSRVNYGAAVSRGTGHFNYTHEPFSIGYIGSLSDEISKQWKIRVHAMLQLEDFVLFCNPLFGYTDLQTLFTQRDYRMRINKLNTWLQTEYSSKKRLNHRAWKDESVGRVSWDSSAAG